MRKWARDGFLIVVGIVCSGFVFSFHYTRIYNNEIAQSSKKDIPAVREIPVVGELHAAEETPTEIKTRIAKNLTQVPTTTDTCSCTSSKTQKTHNFCYVDPQNTSSLGQKFDCQSVEYLENLNLLQKPASEVNLAEPTRKSNEVVFVSAISDNHHFEGYTSYRSIRKIYPNQKYILYGLKLDPFLLKGYDNDKNMEFRQFNVSKYPSYVSNWMEYRFKPLIIAEVLQEYDNIWWIDAHITFSAPNITTDTYKEISERRNNQTHPLKSPIVFFIFSSHSNFAVLNPKLLDFFPTKDIALLKDEIHGGQMGANVFYFAKTEFSMEIMKWWVLCALDPLCMNPPGAQVRCVFDQDRNKYYANCFRFDQSVINLLLLNQLQDYRTYHGSVGYKFNH